LIPKKNLADLLTQLDRQHRDNDRIRLINAAAEGWNFTCVSSEKYHETFPSIFFCSFSISIQDQVKELTDVQHYGQAKNTTAINLYPKVIDQQNFDKVVISSFKFEEDKVWVSFPLSSLPFSLSSAICISG
jgi:hypothetical protein